MIADPLAYRSRVMLGVLTAGTETAQIDPRHGIGRCPLFERSKWRRRWIAAGLLFTAAPAGAQDWHAAGWHGSSSDGACIATIEYEGAGETELTLFDNGKGTSISVVNANWTARADQRYAVTFVFGGKHFSGTVSGLELDGKRGVLAKVERGDLTTLAAAPNLAVFLDEQFIDKLSLAGSGAAVARLRRCIAEQDIIRAAAERERRRFADRPVDPFAQPAAAPPPPTFTAASPVMAQGRYIAQFFNADSYPPAALRAGAQGKVTVRLTIAEDGRVSDCAVTMSSGNDDLDSTTCRIMRTRVRFGIGAAGRTTSQTIRWALPVEAPPPELPQPVPVP